MPVFQPKKNKLSPARTLALGFIIIIIAGALLLFMPFSSRDGNFTDFADCLFTAASATCVTGISVLETYTHWSIIGQIIIVLLIQTGGLGFVTLVTFFNFAIGKKIGLLKANSISGDFSMSGLSATKKLFTRIVAVSLSVELIGALLLMLRFIPRYGGYGAFMAVFTAISAFCNAGFDLFGIDRGGAGLTGYTDDPYVLTIIALLIIFGGLGFIVWEELLAYRKERHFSLHTKIVLISTGILLVLGTLIYLTTAFTNPDLFGEYSFGKKLYTAFFASAASRTAGFTAAPYPLANSFSELFTILLMFVGVAPGSTGGGIKITAFAILIATAWSVLRGREETQILGHVVTKQVVYKTLTVLFLSLAFIVSGFFVIHLMNIEMNPLDVLFEVVSAFTTTGYSSGVSEQSGVITKLLMSFIMYVGRIGPVSLMLTFTGSQTVNKSRILPQGEIMV